MSFAQLMAAHATAVSEFIQRATNVPSALWDVPRAPGKWAPAQETRHLALGYLAFTRELRGEGALRLKGKWWQRRLWRWTVLPHILRTGRMPRAVRAPREVRPQDAPGDRDALLAELRDRVSGFEATVLATRTTDPRRRVTHPYFGRLPIVPLIRLCTVHTRHHAAFLPSSFELSAIRSSSELSASEQKL